MTVNPALDRASDPDQDAADTRLATRGRARAWQGLDEAIRQLVEQAEGLRLLDDSESSTELGATEAALLRLVSGSGRPGDQELIQMPVLGSQLICGSAPDVRVCEQAARLLRADPVVALVHRGELIVLVQGLSRCDAPGRGSGAAERLAGRITRMHPSLAVGVSAAATGIQDLPALWADAHDAAFLVDVNTEGDRVAFAETRWAELMFRRLRRHLVQCVPSTNPIATLRERDARKGTEMVATLTAWVRHNHDTERAAEACHVHPNTLRYRLRRIAEVGGLDLEDSTQRQMIELMLNIED